MSTPKFIIHVPTIDWKTKKKAKFEDIYNGVIAALKTAKEKRLKKIAFPLLGTGYIGLDENGVKKQLEKAERLFPKLEIILCIKK